MDFAHKRFTEEGFTDELTDGLTEGLTDAIVQPDRPSEPSSKKALLAILQKCTTSEDLTEFGNFALELARENRDKLLKSETVCDRKQLRDVVWENQFGTQGIGICPLCNQTRMKWYGSEWEMGHIISQKDGGPLIEINLRPICRGCNHMVFDDSLYRFARLFSGAMERLKIIDFLKPIPYNDPTRFPELLDQDQFRMKLIDARYENDKTRKELESLRIHLDKEKDALATERIILEKEKESIINDLHVLIRKHNE